MKEHPRLLSSVYQMKNIVVNKHILWLVVVLRPSYSLFLFSDSTMGCVKSKENKGPALKYQPDNPNTTSAGAHQGHYGPEPTLMGHSPAAKMHNNTYNSHTAALTPFGGASSVMTPFGGASTSFTSVSVSSPYPTAISGQSVRPISGWLFTSVTVGRQKLCSGLTFKPQTSAAKRFHMRRMV